MAKKLAMFWLRWDKVAKVWTLYRPKSEGWSTPYYSLWDKTTAATKKDAIWWAAKDVRSWAEGNEKPARLNICTKKGKITKGGDGERSYGADSRRRKG